MTGAAQPSSPDFAASLPKAPERDSPATSAQSSAGQGGTGLFATAQSGQESDPLWVIVIFALFALLSGLILGGLAGLQLRSSRAASAR